MTLADDADVFIEGLEAYVAEAKDRQAHRRARGRELSKAQREKLSTICDLLIGLRDPSPALDIAELKIQIDDLDRRACAILRTTE